MAHPPSSARTFRVRRYECDAYGHVNNTAYLRYLDEAEYEAGLQPEGDPGIRVVDIEFLAPLAFGDEVTVTGVTEGQEPLRRGYEFVNPENGERAARAKVVWASRSFETARLELVPQPPRPAAAV
ncbi:MAG TPA: acyl-CoA thioesterase, partial [Acidimicrobiia bacterium]